MSDAPKAPAGWYPSPTVADVEQWWDGEQWTTRARAAEGAAPAPRAAQSPTTPLPATAAAPAKPSPAAVSPVDAVLYRTPQARDGLDPADRGLVVMSFVLAVLLPIVGFVMGIVVATKRGHGADGAMIMVVSVIAFVVWAQVLA